MEMAGDFWPRLPDDGLVTKDHARDVAFLFDPAAAMIGKAGIVIADDPDPVDLRRQAQQQFPSIAGK